MLLGRRNFARSNSLFKHELALLIGINLVPAHVRDLHGFIHIPWDSATSGLMHGSPEDWIYDG